jgi:hypothetical protein
VILARRLSCLFLHCPQPDCASEGAHEPSREPEGLSTKQARQKKTGTYPKKNNRPSTRFPPFPDLRNPSLDVAQVHAACPLICAALI